MTISGPGSLTAPQIGNIDNSRLWLAGGAQLSVAATSYTATGRNFAEGDAMRPRLGRKGAALVAAMLVAFGCSGPPAPEGPREDLLPRDGVMDLVVDFPLADLQYVTDAIEFGSGPFSGDANFLVRLAQQNSGNHVYVDLTKLD